MKSSIVAFVLLIGATIFFFFTSGEEIHYKLLNSIADLKIKYERFVDNIQEKTEDFSQFETRISDLKKKNIQLNRELRTLKHKLNQYKDIKTILPQLKKLPKESIALVQPLSYVKLNKFSQLLLTMPANITTSKSYGLLNGKEVAGVARVVEHQLYGYLLKDPKCQFSVFVGEKHFAGIAAGNGDSVVVKFLPQWANITKGDKVITSGLDGIFYRNIPVGVVQKVSKHGAYSVAEIEAKQTERIPTAYWLINNAKLYLAQGFDSSKTKGAGKEFLYCDCKEKAKHSKPSSNATTENITSIPEVIQKHEDEVVIPEDLVEEHPKPKRKIKKHISSTLELF